MSVDPMSISSPNADITFNVIGQNFDLVTDARLMVGLWRNGKYTGDDESPRLTIDSSWHASALLETFGEQGEWKPKAVTGYVDGVRKVLWGEE